MTPNDAERVVNYDMKIFYSKVEGSREKGADSSISLPYLFCC